MTHDCVWASRGPDVLPECMCKMVWTEPHASLCNFYQFHSTWTWKKLNPSPDFSQVRSFYCEMLHHGGSSKVIRQSISLVSFFFFFGVPFLLCFPRSFCWRIYLGTRAQSKDFCLSFCCVNTQEKKKEEKKNSRLRLCTCSCVLQEKKKKKLRTQTPIAFNKLNMFICIYDIHIYMA